MKANKTSINIWDKIAVDFGQTGPKYWNAFGNRLIELSSINSGGRVLDIGMGRGASLFPALEKVGDNGYVIGIDSSEEMVNETNKDIINRNICNVEVQNMNAQYLNFENNYFDNVICGFGLGYLLLSENKLRDIIRVLKNGGEAGFSIWGIQEDQKWLTDIINEYLPPIDKSDCNPDIPKFNTIDTVMKILYNSGFQNIKFHQENSIVTYKNKDEWWHEMCSNNIISIFEQIEMLGGHIYKKFKDDIFKGLDKFNRDNKLYFNMPVIYAFGQKNC
jgi:ubiquinone/menaquinone biosynthesis C-methylase UbiE